MKLNLGVVELYFLFISAVSLLATIYDKTVAQRNGQRISEKNLIFMAVFGGSVAMYFTMLITRHKTRHRKFMVGLPVIIALQVLVVFLFRRFF